jgi:PKD repeat protein
MRTALLLLIVGCLAIGSIAVAASPISIAIANGTEDPWVAIATTVEAGFDVEISLHPTYELYLQWFEIRGAGRHLVMFRESWISRYGGEFEDLSDIASALTAAGASLAYYGNDPIGVRLAFDADWYVGVKQRPENDDALRALLAEAAGVRIGGTTVAPTGIAANPAPGKPPLAQHQRNVDGALTSLMASVEEALGQAVSSLLSFLPSAARDALQRAAAMNGIPLATAPNGETAVTVVVEAGSAAVAAQQVRAMGVSNRSIETSTASGLVRVEVPLSQLDSFLRTLSGSGYIRAPYIPYPNAVNGQGIAAVNASAFHSAGITGSGVRIAVIDLGFAGLSQSQANGDLPYNVQSNDLTGSGLTSGISHGTAVAEIVHEIAPDAQLYLIKIADEVDLDQAVTYCISNGIDIINHSLGWYNTNFYDGTGIVAGSANRAISNGILWVNSAGNEARRHWDGSFSDGNADGWHDQDITFTAQGGNSIGIYLTWNDWPAASTDFDLYLYNPSGQLVASSTKYQTGVEEPTEAVFVTAMSSGLYRIRVRGSGSGQLELFNLYQDLSSPRSAGSILAPANVFEVVSVGAVDVNQYSSGPVAEYSSRGPSNAGYTKPDLVAPDHVTTGTYPYVPFLGTSCSAPHVAGAAALLLDETPSLSTSALRSRVLTSVLPGGDPNAFGQGRLYLNLTTQPNQPPTAAYTFSPTNPTAGQSVSFNGSGSSDPDGTIVQWQWSFGDGQSATGQFVNHSYGSSGTYTITLTVRDDDGATDSETQQISVGGAPNQPPTAAYTFSPTNPTAGQSVSFNGSGSSDPDGNVVQWQWSFGDGQSATGQFVNHSYGSSGTYTITLTVRDDDGATDSETQQISVGAPARPDLVIANLTVSPQQPTLGTTLTFSITIANQGNANAGFFRVRLDGAGSSAAGFVGGLNAGASTTVTLTRPLSQNTETFVVTADDQMQVSESNENNNTASRTVSAVTPPPTAEAGGPYTGTAGVAISFDGTASSGSINSYSWSFGDGSGAQGATVSHTYTSSGSYTATLTVSGPGGQSTDTAQVTVNPAQPSLSVQLSLPKSTYQSGETIVITYTLNRSAYLYICDVDANGTVRLVYPNYRETNPAVAAGTRTVPGVSGYSIVVGPPTGTETLYAFATTSPLSIFPTSFGGSFPILSYNPTGFRNSVLQAMASQFAASDRDDDILSFTVTSPPPTTGKLPPKEVGKMDSGDVVANA